MTQTSEQRTMPRSSAGHTRTALAELTIPAEYRQVRLARLLGGGVAAQLGLDVDQVEDVRLAVDELCAVLLECAVVRDRSDDRLTVRFEADATGIAVSVRRPEAVLVDEPSPITEAILNATCTSWSVSGPLVRATLPLSTTTTASPHVPR